MPNFIAMDLLSIYDGTPSDLRQTGPIDQIVTFFITNSNYTQH
jgi:hypothetical protein